MPEMPPTGLECIGLGVVSFVAWFFSMLAGGGSPLVLIPMVNGMLGPQAIAPVITVGMLVGNAQRSWFFWREIDWKLTRWYLPGATAGAILGAYTFSQIRLEWLQAVVALLLLGMVVNYLLNRGDRSFTVKAWYFLPVSFLNAFGSAIIGSTGPVMNPLYLHYGLIKEQMVATKAFHKTVLHIVKLIAYLTLGTLNPTYLAYGLLIGLAAMPANWLGKQVLEKMSPQQFRHAVFVFVAFSGLWMLWEQRSLLSFS